MLSAQPHTSPSEGAEVHGTGHRFNRIRDKRGRAALGHAASLVSLNHYSFVGKLANQPTSQPTNQPANQQKTSCELQATLLEPASTETACAIVTLGGEVLGVDTKSFVQLRAYLQISKTVSNWRAPRPGPAQPQPQPEPQPSCFEIR